MISGVWLAESNNTNLDPPPEFLPEEYTGLYYEGGNGVIIGASEVDFRQIAAIFTISFIRERFGYGHSLYSDAYVRILNILLVQQQVFGVILVDSFTPPGIGNEFFEFEAYTQDACVGVPDSTVPVFSTCQDADIEPEYVEAAKSVPAFRES